MVGHQAEGRRYVPPILIRLPARFESEGRGRQRANPTHLLEPLTDRRGRTLPREVVSHFLNPGLPASQLRLLLQQDLPDQGRPALFG